MGEDRKGIRFRWAERQGSARRFVLRQEPAYRLSLHVQPGLGRGLRALFVLGRPLRISSSIPSFPVSVSAYFLVFHRHRTACENALCLIPVMKRLCVAAFEPG